MSNGAPYRGRFAPSPTGPLHLGSLIAALASYLDARHKHGTWLVRMDDLDPPREEPGAARQILDSLRQHGLQWDEEVLYQSQRSAAYSAALQVLDNGGHLFHCSCTRQQTGPDGSCSGNCREQQPVPGMATATRVKVPADCLICFKDGIQGEQQVSLGMELADFVVKRKDGLDAYQLAVAVDDAWQGVTHIVRGSDLLDSSARQIFLQRLLGYTTPVYSHIPVITDASGQKFSKQNHAPALDGAQAPANLRTALDFLRQEQPPLECTGVHQILPFATGHWTPGRIPSVMGLAATRAQLIP